MLFGVIGGERRAERRFMREVRAFLLKHGGKRGKSKGMKREQKEAIGGDKTPARCGVGPQKRGNAFGAGWRNGTRKKFWTGFGGQVERKLSGWRERSI